MREARTLRWVALVSVGAIVVHQLRYYATYGHDAHGALLAQGHSYLPLAGALSLLLFLASVVEFVRWLIRARGGDPHSRTSPSLKRQWLVAAGALLATYVTQEELEGILFDGHPAGLHAVFDHGGIVVVAFAAAVGAVIALLQCGAHFAIAAVAGRGAHLRARPAAGRWVRLPGLAPPRRDVLAWNLAGRAPPL